MKKILFLLVIATSFSCSQSSSKQAMVVTDSLPASKETKKEAYKPGLGEFMSAVQMHHAKLWFAGINNNWKLAEYESGEMKEMLTVAEEFETDRPEVKDIHTVYPALDSVVLSVNQKNLPLFKTCFEKMTESCNSCHRSHHFEFNVITIPTAPPVTNQDFKIH